MVARLSAAMFQQLSRAAVTHASIRVQHLLPPIQGVLVDHCLFQLSSFQLNHANKGRPLLPTPQDSFVCVVPSSLHRIMILSKSLHNLFLCDSPLSRHLQCNSVQ